MNDVRGWVSAYFLTFLLAGLLAHRRRPGWRRSVGLSLAGLGSVAIGGVYGNVSLGLGAIGDWWPVVAVPLAYWVPAPLAGSPNRALEGWLMALDWRLGRLVSPDGLPRIVDQSFEAAYLMVYPMVPVGLAVVLWWAGTARVEAYWQTVLLAVLPCYALLPLLPTRPPRQIERHGLSPDSAPLRQANLRFMDVFSNRWNTLPSAHASGAAAVAVEVARAGSPLAPVFVILAAGIAAATVRGRYHYAADTVAGLVWAGLVCAATGG